MKRTAYRVLLLVASEMSSMLRNRAFRAKHGYKMDFATTIDNHLRRMTALRGWLDVEATVGNVTAKILS